MAVEQGRWRTCWVIAALAAAAPTVGASAARADDLDAKLAAYESETGQLAADLPRPNQISGAAGQRRLLDAEIAFSLGDYDAAALMLFELATRPGADRETAMFYLAESLYEKGDRGAARGYYEQITAAGNVASKYYQPALERLIEIAIVQKDDVSIAQSVAALDRISPGLRRPEVPYVRGKLAYSQNKYDEAIAFFQDVPKASAPELAAAYFLATTYVAKKDLQRATDIFTDLISRKPQTANDRRIIELSQLALGRLYYERDQASKSIDSYLLVDRHSDLFADALYEVAWVYVKSKQYDKALRALELLALSDPQSTKTPTVRILEGNLRIRKAQMLRTAQIQGTLDNRSTDDPATEYDRAVQVFTETHDMYMPSYAALAQMVDSGGDPAQYLTQIAGRSTHVFQIAALIPEAAAQYLRDEPEVQRVVSVETDLGEISANLGETEATIARLEGVLAARDKMAVYPALASRRSRIGELERNLIELRSNLAEQELGLVDRTAPPFGGAAARGQAPVVDGRSGQLAALSASRKQLAESYARMPDATRAAADHLARNLAQYDALEGSVASIVDAIGSTQAMAVALRKYIVDVPDVPADQRQTLAGALDNAAREAQAIEDALDGVRREIQIGRDLAPLGDGAAVSARAARKQLKAAEDAEHKVLAASASRDRARSQQLVALGDRAARLADQLDQAEAQIDSIVDQGLAEARTALIEAKAALATSKAELASHEAETRSIGGTVLGASLTAVKARFYDIVIRTDVGNVDVSWSQKADNDDDLKRLNLSRQRELKQLRDEFKDILDAGTPKPSAPAKKLEMPMPETSQPAGSPDKGGGDRRITPGDAKPGAPGAAAVKPDAGKKASGKNTPRPDAKQPAAKRPDASKGGAR